MNLSKITRPVLQGAALLHRAALKYDCNTAHRAADRRFDKAAHQLELLNAAKAQLAKLQNAAIEQRATANRSTADAAIEMQSSIADL